MDPVIIALEGIVFCALFTLMVFLTTGKNNTAQIDNYPPEIREEYFRTHERVPTEPLSGRVIARKGTALVVMAVLLWLMACIAGAKTFGEGFLVSFALMALVGCWDTFFLDWVLFANMKRFRLEGTEHMDAAYHQKWFHLKGMLFPGLLFALIAGMITGALTAIF